ncbi:MAG: TetR/AcrR family transcriptional regulator [Dehalococcoidia bacterium]|nr:TetR/AcrR family transcriptional regulator [Dehalococcoidia bacterium]
MQQADESEPPVDTGLRGYRVRDPEQRAARHREILDAAARVFGARGYYGATMDDVAAEMGLTKGVVYYYFRSKDEILFEIVASAVTHACERLLAVLKTPAPPAEQLHRALLNLLTFNLDESDEAYYAMLVIPYVRALPPEKRAEIRRLQRQFQDPVVQLIRDGIEDGSFIEQDPAAAAFTLLTAANNLSSWVHPESTWPRDTIARQVADLLVRGLLRNPEPR